ncbi:hypothetical protein BCR41DRAFT_424436 [Lobosporangium transversale]|uniref:Uncharacterized protein n=1 Tax=Lobosporangium transversale TaxID=64571 RepID=A0A1Y2GID2_9FUNG|nr:hypothetical protein BCR41DRAFT_424436 [Lobosporangium transversale]ORZ08462.1 hypothetical protein BCR41DRAFT_424436 [Lobosporangium transversale]|eukprot:XP_021878390.1 hypothetical protein BCR41DRAFT_424436 [Lobosporangium transversale]
MAKSKSKKRNQASTHAFPERPRDIPRRNASVKTSSALTSLENNSSFDSKHHYSDSSTPTQHAPLPLPSPSLLSCSTSGSAAFSMPSPVFPPHTMPQMRPRIGESLFVSQRPLTQNGDLQDIIHPSPSPQIRISSQPVMLHPSPTPSKMSVSIDIPPLATLLRKKEPKEQSSSMATEQPASSVAPKPADKKKALSYVMPSNPSSLYPLIPKGGKVLHWQIAPEGSASPWTLSSPQASPLSVSPSLQALPSSYSSPQSQEPQESQESRSPSMPLSTSQPTIEDLKEMAESTDTTKMSRKARKQLYASLAAADLSRPTPKDNYNKYLSIQFAITMVGDIPILKDNKVANRAAGEAIFRAIVHVLSRDFAFMTANIFFTEYKRLFGRGKGSDIEPNPLDHYSFADILEIRVLKTVRYYRLKWSYFEQIAETHGLSCPRSEKEVFISDLGSLIPISPLSPMIVLAVTDKNYARLVSTSALFGELTPSILDPGVPLQDFQSYLPVWYPHLYLSEKLSELMATTTPVDQSMINLNAISQANITRQSFLTLINIAAGTGMNAKKARKMLGRHGARVLGPTEATRLESRTRTMMVSPVVSTMCNDSLGTSRPPPAIAISAATSIPSSPDGTWTFTTEMDVDRPSVPHIEAVSANTQSKQLQRLLVNAAQESTTLIQGSPLAKGMLTDEKEEAKMSEVCAQTNELTLRPLQVSPASAATDPDGPGYLLPSADFSLPRPILPQLPGRPAPYEQKRPWEPPKVPRETILATQKEALDKIIDYIWTLSIQPEERSRA